jgi:RHS repeat-associated protein
MVLARYKPYGIDYQPSGSEGFKYTGKHVDSSGLYYYGARYYEPETGRFTTADTLIGSLTNPQTLNMYLYCRNNPQKYVDPDGSFFFAIPVVYGVALAITFTLPYLVPAVEGLVKYGMELISKISGFFPEPPSQPPTNMPGSTTYTPPSPKDQLNQILNQPGIIYTKPSDSQWTEDHYGHAMQWAAWNGLDTSIMTQDEIWNFYQQCARQIVDDYYNKGTGELYFDSAKNNFSIRTSDGWQVAFDTFRNIATMLYRGPDWDVLRFWRWGP